MKLPINLYAWVLDIFHMPRTPIFVDTIIEFGNE